MSSPQGYVCIVLHSHLPYVLGHGVWPFGSDWLCEAAAETYLPLLRVLDTLAAENIQAKLSIGITPVLMEQLADPRFPVLFDAYLLQKQTAAEADEKAFVEEEFCHRASVAAWWKNWYATARIDYQERYGKDILGAFRKHQDAGNIEILTCAATHGYLPLLGRESAVRGQLETGIATYQHHMKRAPRGIWLPECAYRPHGLWQFAGAASEERHGLEEFLAWYGIDHFVVDSHLISGKKSKVSYTARFFPNGTRTHAVDAATEERDASVLDIYRVEDPESGRGATAFVRDPEVALQVWSGEVGYPGDPVYLDFHKKHHPGGIRYWAVTGRDVDMADKAEYDPSLVEARIRAHAEHFVGMCRGRLLWAHKQTGEVATVTAPFDTELFGHWWFEGPLFLQEVVRLLAKETEIKAVTMEERVQAPEGVERSIQLREGSWGEEGDHRVWLNDETFWTWSQLHRSEARQAALAQKHCEHPLWMSVLQQMTRSLALLESSDWQFLIHTKSARDYAEARVIGHATDVEFLAGCAESLLAKGELDETQQARFEEIVARDSIFAEIRPMAWA